MSTARVIAAALFFASPVGAAGSASARRRELGAVQKELEAARRQIEDYKRQEQSLGRDLMKLQSRNAEARKRMMQLQSGVQDAERRKRELKDRLAAMGQVGGVWTSALDSDLAAYQAERAERSEVYGSSDLWAEAFRRAAIKEKAALIDRLRGVSRSAELAAAESGRSAVRLQTKAQRALADQQSSQQQYQQKKEAIAQTQQMEAATLSRVKELEENAAALTKLIRSIGKTTRAKKPGVIGRLDLPRNSLPWPAVGTVVRPFGRQRNPELDAWVINQGILIGTAPQAPVKSVGRGRVIFAGPFRSYGQVLIIDHGSNFFTIYGELGGAVKGKGDSVKAGETIARAGEMKGGGGSVYLEIRRGTEALDPLLWLTKR